MSHLVNQMGSVDDIRCSLQHGTYTLEQLQAALDNESAKQQPRQTVIKLLETTIKRKRKEQQS